MDGAKELNMHIEGVHPTGRRRDAVLSPGSQLMRYPMHLVTPIARDAERINYYLTL